MNLNQLTAAAERAASAMDTLEHETLQARRKRFLAYGHALLALRKTFKSRAAFYRHLESASLKGYDKAFRDDAMWMAENWAELEPLADLCPAANPTELRRWHRARGSVAKTPHPRTAKPVYDVKRKPPIRRYTDYSPKRVAREHLESGRPLTELEAFVYYGALSLPAEIVELRAKGIKVETSWVPYTEVLARLNKSATLTPPTALPLEGITLTQYRLVA